jgi:hypothetical protein
MIAAVHETNQRRQAPYVPPKRQKDEIGDACA